MKGFENTKFAGVLQKAKEITKGKGGEIAGIVLKAASGNIGGAISETMEMLRGEDSMEAKELLMELDLKKMEIENELFKLQAQDVQNARDNETARDISENASFLSKNIHEIIALLVVGTWVFTWFFKTEISQSDLVGVVTLILGYLYGRTKPQG
jgi:hypothetical protein